LVSVIENWAQLEGTVRTVRPDPELPDQLVAVVDVDAVEPVQDDEGKPFPNLFADAAGTSVELHVPAAPAATPCARRLSRVTSAASSASASAT